MKPSDQRRDRELDLAWRAANRDEPPTAVDATIAAAARRAVSAGPRSAHAARAWWPVAAAAVVALVAIGIVEMTPREQLVPTVPSAQQAPAPAAEPATRRDAVKDVPAPTPAAPQRAPAPAAEAKRKVEQSSSPSRAESSPAASEAPRMAAKPGNPFPASPSDASPASNAVAPPLDRLTARPAPPSRQETPPTNAGASAQQAPVSRPQSDGEAAPGRAAGALAGRNQAAAPSGPAALDKRAAEAETKTSDAEGRTVEEWIRTIRRYKAEGRNDLAAKELVLFRARYLDRADTLLPADLREDKP
jgi:hypothetical protein